jgi:hypothetical protein
MMADGINPTRKRRFGVIPFLLAPVACFGIFLFVAFNLRSNPPADELVTAFVTADIERAKAVTAPQRWEMLTEAMKGRQPFHCSIDGWFDEDTGIGGVGMYDERVKGWNWGLDYQCASPSARFCLAISDIVVQEIEGRPKVVSWGKICEAHDYRYKCQEMCR